MRSWWLYPSVLLAVPGFTGTGPNSNLTPVDTATNDVLTYVLGFGVLGIVAVAYTLGIIVPGKRLEKIREEARADLQAELDRVLAEKTATETRLIAERREAENQRDAALKVGTDQLIPLLVSFTSASQSLIPLLQALVSQREVARDRDPRDR